MSFLDQIKQRRTIYAIGKKVTLDQNLIEHTIQEAVRFIHPLLIRKLHVS